MQTCAEKNRRSMNTIDSWDSVGNGLMFRDVSGCFGMFRVALKAKSEWLAAWLSILQKLPPKSRKYFL